MCLIHSARLRTEIHTADTHKFRLPYSILKAEQTYIGLNTNQVQICGVKSISLVLNQNISRLSN